MRKFIGTVVFILTLFVFAAGRIFAQDSNSPTIKGTVYDSDTREPISGASVVVKGTSTGVITDASGAYSLRVKATPVTVKVSFVGYKPVEIDVYDAAAVVDVQLNSASNNLNAVVVTARRTREVMQDVPIPISVVTAERVENAGAFNVNRLKEMTPSVQMYSSNPRNTGLSIRGLGTTFGLTNDGIDPGVGFYIDGVYYARTAAATIDFLDISQIEVLRGPQGTLFGKNTTAGAFNITTKAPEFKHSATFEASYGNYGFIQAKASVTGAITKKLAARATFVGTQRDGLIYNVKTQKYTNDLNNLGAKLKLLYRLSSDVEFQLTGDYSRQRPDGYAQVIAGVAPTQRADYRQFNSIIADLGYSLPSTNPFDRIIDHDTPWRSGQDFGGLALNADFRLGRGTLTSTSAYRYWKWDPSNDRDFTGLQGLALSQAPSIHKQWSQEVRWSGILSQRLTGVFGIFSFWQDLAPNDAHTEEAGVDQWRFSQNSTSALWATPGLLEGYGQRTYPNLNTFSGAIYAQLTWEVVPEKLKLLPGLRLNYDKKKVDFRREVYGGLQTSDADLIALQRAVYSAQEFQVETDKTDVSGQLTVQYKPVPKVSSYATFATSFKPVGLNLGGLPRDNGRDMIELAEIKPERVLHYEIGAKTSPLQNATLNLTVFRSDVYDYQAQVQTADLAVNRGYLANAEQIRVQGVELEGQIKAGDYSGLNFGLAYTDGKYVKFTNAPPPLEETGGPTFKDISGSRLPGISEWAFSFGGETGFDGRLLNRDGNWFFAFDGLYRSNFSSNPSPSKYLIVPEYTIFNARAGFRAGSKSSIFLWGRNIFDKDYFEQLLPGAGNAGHYAAVLGDPRTWGVTLRYSF
ncbi:MAG: TonB-dependent receptor [Bacteroidales bacterium]|jgi:iron complex outermembrane receptor protein|nr:TonB-dependent receptor [Bacteroidales bacterium]